MAIVRFPPVKNRPMKQVRVHDGDGRFSAAQKMAPSPPQAKDVEYEPEEELFHTERQTQRFIMRMIDSPFKDGTPPAPSGAVRCC